MKHRLMVRCLCRGQRASGIPGILPSAKPRHVITVKPRLGRVDDEAVATYATSFPERHLEPGAVTPSDDVRTELRGYLEADSSRVGEVYRLLEGGLGADEIAERLEGGAAGAWQYRRMVRALLDGSLPSVPTIALAAARRYRTVLKTPTLQTGSLRRPRAELALWPSRHPCRRARARCGSDKSVVIDNGVRRYSLASRDNIWMMRVTFGAS
jgi:hypothetical protein